jgi:hypothetical protein
MRVELIDDFFVEYPATVFGPTSHQNGILAALKAPGRTERVRKMAKRFGVDPGTVQRISRPFDGVIEAA